MTSKVQHSISKGKGAEHRCRGARGSSALRFAPCLSPFGFRLPAFGRTAAIALVCLLGAALPLAAAEGGSASPPAAGAPDAAEKEEKEEENAAVSFEEVVVTPKRTVVDTALAGKVVLAAEAEAMPLIDNDLFRAVESRPGVAGGDYNTRFSVRGGDPDETLVLLDGMALYEPYHLQDYGGALSVIDLLTVSRATLLPGGFSARYGDKLSAVLDVDLKEPAERIEVNAGVDLLNAHLLVSGAPLLASFRAGYIGLLMSMMQSEESFVPHYGDVLLKFSPRISPAERMSLNILWAGDVNRIDEPGDQDDVHSRYDNNLNWVHWRRDIEETVTLEAWLFAGAARRRREEGLADLDERNLGTSGIKSVVSADGSGPLRLEAGAELRWMRGRYRYVEAARGLDIDADEKGVSLKAFASATWTVAEALALRAGARLIHLTSTRLWHAAPRAALIWTPAPGWRFHAAGGVYHQPVDPLHVPVEAAVEGTRKPEKALHAVAAARWESDALSLHAGVDVYYKEMDDLTGFVKDLGRASQRYQPKDAGWAAGAEIFVDKGFGDARLHLAYALSVSKEILGGREYFGDHDRRHDFRAGLSLRPGAGWTIYAGWRVHSGEPYTRAWYEGGVKRYGPRNAARLPPYHSLDVRVARTFAVEGTEIRVYLQILNLYDRKNVHEISFEEKEQNGTTVYERKEEPLFPLLPTLGVEVTF